MEMQKEWRIALKSDDSRLKNGGLFCDWRRLVGSGVSSPSRSHASPQIAHIPFPSSRFTNIFLSAESARAAKLARLGEWLKAVLESEIRLQVSFQWKNPDFLFRDPDFLFRNPGFLLKNG